VPLWGTWTGFPSDALGLTVKVEVTSERSQPESNLSVESPARPALES
jgi:hypothetical protein